MRLAGTCRRYSKSAIPQLASAATYQARPLRFLRCAYQANVMKTFEPIRSSVVDAIAGMAEFYHDAQVILREWATLTLSKQPILSATNGGSDPSGRIVPPLRRSRNSPIEDLPTEP